MKPTEIMYHKAYKQQPNKKEKQIAVNKQVHWCRHNKLENTVLL